MCSNGPDAVAAYLQRNPGKAGSPEARAALAANAASATGRPREVITFFHPLDEFGFLSHWYESQFVMGGAVFRWAEQALMAAKAELFADAAVRAQILAAGGPAECKALGRTVKPYDEAQWKTARHGVALALNTAKFVQAPLLARQLVATGDCCLAEASRDMVWGTGRPAGAPGCSIPGQWRGDNLLGTVLQEVRQLLRQPRSGEEGPALPPPRAPAVVVSDTLQQVQAIIAACATHGQSPVLAAPEATGSAFAAACVAEISDAAGTATPADLAVCRADTVPDFVDSGVGLATVRAAEQKAACRELEPATAALFPWANQPLRRPAPAPRALPAPSGQRVHIDSVAQGGFRKELSEWLRRAAAYTAEPGVGAKAGKPPLRVFKESDWALPVALGKMYDMSKYPWLTELTGAELAPTAADAVDCRACAELAAATGHPDLALIAELRAGRGFSVGASLKNRAVVLVPPHRSAIQNWAAVDADLRDRVAKGWAVESAMPQTLPFVMAPAATVPKGVAWRVVDDHKTGGGYSLNDWAEEARIPKLRWTSTREAATAVRILATAVPTEAKEGRSAVHGFVADFQSYFRYFWAIREERGQMCQVWARGTIEALRLGFGSKGAPACCQNLSGLVVHAVRFYMDRLEALDPLPDAVCARAGSPEPAAAAIRAFWAARASLPAPHQRLYWLATYTDDTKGLAVGLARTRRLLAVFLWVVHRAKLRVAWKKFQGITAHSAVFLGLGFVYSQLRHFVTDDRRDKLLLAIVAVLQSFEAATNTVDQVQTRSLVHSLGFVSCGFHNMRGHLGCAFRVAHADTPARIKRPMAAIAPSNLFTDLGACARMLGRGCSVQFGAGGRRQDVNWGQLGDPTQRFWGFSADACGHQGGGLGAVRVETGSDGQSYAMAVFYEVSAEARRWFTICGLECAAGVLGRLTFLERLRCSRLRIACDNSGVCATAASGKARTAGTQAWHAAATDIEADADIESETWFLRGYTNALSDATSRKEWQRLEELCAAYGLQLVMLRPPPRFLELVAEITAATQVAYAGVGWTPELDGYPGVAKSESALDDLSSAQEELLIRENKFPCDAEWRTHRSGHAQ